MQSVVTGQAPITLERKITSGGKQVKAEDSNTITETNRIPQTKIKNTCNTYIQIICQTNRRSNRNRRDSMVPARKRQDETNDFQIEIEKGNEKKKKKSQHQVRKKEHSTPTPALKGNTFIHYKLP